MNPMTNIKNIQKLSKNDLARGAWKKGSWHDDYRDSAWIFFGGMPFALTDGDVVCIFSQYGEIIQFDLIRDKDTGKSRGFGFLCYEDQRSTDLAVDNFNGTKIVGRTIRVDHVKEYKVPKHIDKMDAETLAVVEKGIAPEMPSSEDEVLYLPPEKKIKKEKKHKTKKVEKEKKSPRSKEAAEKHNELPLDQDRRSSRPERREERRGDRREESPRTGRDDGRADNELPLDQDRRSSRPERREERRGDRREGSPSTSRDDGRQESSTGSRDERRFGRDDRRGVIDDKVPSSYKESSDRGRHRGDRLGDKHKESDIARRRYSSEEHDEVRRYQGRVERGRGKATPPPRDKCETGRRKGDRGGSDSEGASRALRKSEKERITSRDRESSDSESESRYGRNDERRRERYDKSRNRGKSSDRDEKRKESLVRSHGGERSRSGSRDRVHRR